MAAKSNHPSGPGVVMSVRIPHDLREAYRSAAAEMGVNVGVLVTAALEANAPGRPKKAPAKKAPTKAVACTHSSAVTISGGMKRCDACGDVRGADGTWRKP